MIDRYVRFAARQLPWSVALSDGRNHITFRQLDDGIDRVGTALLAAGVADMGPVIGVNVRDPYQHILIVYACARLGIGTTSLFPAMAVNMAALSGASAVVTDDPAFTPLRQVPVITAERGWFEAAFAAPLVPLPRVALDPAGIARVQLSSGTTGQPKPVAISWAVTEARIGEGLSIHGMRARVLSLIGIESGGLGAYTGAWRHMGCMLTSSGSPAELARALPILHPTTLVASPVQIAALIAALPDDFTPLPEPLTVMVAGGRLSRTIREQITLRLGGLVTPLYASTEAGSVAGGHHGRMPDEHAVGWVMPSVEVEVVDAEDRPLPPGEVGQFRIAGPGVVAGYRDGPGDAFRDGWFYPGDLGSVDRNGLMRVVGRADEVMNFGGEKFVPETLEDPVRALPGVGDVAAFALRDPRGDDQPWLAIVRAGEIPDGALAQVLTIPLLPPVRIAWIDAIPRTLMGKVRRDELQQAARRLGEVPRADA